MDQKVDLFGLREIDVYQIDVNRPIGSKSCEVGQVGFENEWCYRIS